jgi:hypothetical protein
MSTAEGTTQAPILFEKLGERALGAALDFAKEAPQRRRGDALTAQMRRRGSP